MAKSTRRGSLPWSFVYGLDSPLWVQYLKWIQGVFTGDFGESFQLNRSVSSVLAQRLPLTIVIAVSTLIFTWAIALPIGLYSAVRQYKFGDYLATTIGFLGLAVPNFLIALVLMYIGYRYFGQSVGGLFSPEFVDAQWNLGSCSTSSPTCGFRSWSSGRQERPASSGSCGPICSTSCGSPTSWLLALEVCPSGS